MLAITLLDWFAKFPALWALAGLLVGGVVTAVVAILIGRKFGAQVTKSADVLVKLQEKQLKSMGDAMILQQQLSDRAMAQQKEHYDAELAETRRKAEVDLKTMTDERNTYRTTLHAERNDLGAQLTEAKLQIERLEARPDLTSLLEFEQESDKRRESFYTTLGGTMKKLVELIGNVGNALAEHDKKTVERMQSFIEPVLDAMREVVDSCNAMKKNTRLRKSIVRKAGDKLRKAAAPTERP